MRVAVLASGAGSNLQALLQAEAEGRLGPARIVLVLSNRPGAPALERGRAAGKDAVLVDHRSFVDRDAFDQAMLAELRARAVDAVVLAGFMRILGRAFVDAFSQRIVNVHPSLLPAFPGLSAPAQAIACGVKVSGCTVHLVEYGVDTGPIIAQACVPVTDQDDEHSLHERIKAKERALLPEAVRLLAQGALSCDGRVVRLAEVAPSARDTR